MSNVMKLSELLARAVIVETYEAVAVVREVADRVMDAANTSLAVPDLDQIELSPEGQISIRAGGKVGDPVRRLGQLLQAMLAQSTPPVQVRLVISQATAPEPAYASVREYSDALAYSERRDRAGIIRALRSRADGSPEVSQLGPAPTLDAIAPLADAPPTLPARDDRSGLRRRAVRIAALAVVLSMACTAVITYARPGKLRQGRDEMSVAVVKASDAMGSALVSGVSAVSDRVGLGRLVAAETAQPEAAPALAKTLRPVKMSGRTEPRAATAQVAGGWTVMAFDLGWAPKEDPVNVPSGAVAGGDESSVATERDATGDGAIYAQGSEGVEPPEGRRPQLPSRLPDNLDRHNLGRIELLILENGTVESVKLLNPRPTVHDAMMLSAAKTWEFSPAMKDGRPVKYRKTVWMSVQ